MSWQPIETAPKDGTEILVAYEAARFTRVTIAVWKAHYFNGFLKEWWQTDVGAVPPTHWMPLPDPQSDKQADPSPDNFPALAEVWWQGPKP